MLDLANEVIQEDHRPMRSRMAGGAANALDYAGR